MKYATALLALFLTVAITSQANAQGSVQGAWVVESVNTQTPPDGVELTLSFSEDGNATLAYALPGEPAQSWTYRYKVEGTTLTLESIGMPGKPTPMTYDIRYNEGKLELLTPLPEPEEGALPPEDNREPSWVLVKR